MGGGDDVSDVVGRSEGFSIGAKTCQAALAPAATCTVEVAFQPGTAGTRSGRLTLSDGTNASGSARLLGTGLEPATLSLLPATGSSADYGSVVVGANLVRTFSVTNSGQSAAQMLSITLTGAQAAAFTVVAPSAMDCVVGGLVAAGASCTVQVRLSPTAGAQSASLGVEGMPGGQVTLPLRGKGLRPAALASTTPSHDFGGVQNGASQPFAWVITNGGDESTGVLSVTLPVNFGAASDACTGQRLGAAQSCTVGVKMMANSVSLPGTGTPGGMVSLDVMGAPMFRLTIASTGGGVVQTDDGRLMNCGATTCSALYAPSVTVTVLAVNQNGSNLRFIGWSNDSNYADSCSSGGATCSFALYGSTTLVAEFKRTQGNLIFVSSTTVSAGSGLSAFDQRCNALASAAGINNAAGNSFVAWASTASIPLSTRWTATGGLERIDGRPFALSRAELFAGRVINPNNLDDTGARLSALSVIWTGTNDDGSASAANCRAWTSTQVAASGLTGRAEGGPGLWTSLVDQGCADPSFRIACVQNGSNTTLVNPAPPANAKIAYRTGPVARPNSRAAADSVCAANKPPAFSGRTFVALIATAGTTAARRIDQQATYYRFDGARPGRGADLSLGKLESGLWTRVDGVSETGSVSVWTGADSVSALGTSASTCGDWTSPAGTVVLGQANYSDALFFGYGNPVAGCAGAHALYCIEP